MTLPRAATIGTERCFVPPPTHQPDDCLSPPASVAAGCLRPDSGRLGSETAPAGACAGLPSGPGCGRGRFWRGLGAGARVVARQGGSGLGGGRGAAAAAAFVTKESSAGRAVQGAHPREVGVGGARRPGCRIFSRFSPPYTRRFSPRQISMPRRCGSTRSARSASPCAVDLPSPARHPATGNAEAGRGAFSVETPGCARPAGGGGGFRAGGAGKGALPRSDPRGRWLCSHPLPALYPQLPLQPCLTSPIWLRLRNSISRN